LTTLARRRFFPDIRTFGLGSETRCSRALLFRHSEPLAWVRFHNRFPLARSRAHRWAGLLLVQHSLARKQYTAFVTSSTVSCLSAAAAFSPILSKNLVPTGSTFFSAVQASASTAASLTPRYRSSLQTDNTSQPRHHIPTGSSFILHSPLSAHRRFRRHLPHPPHPSCTITTLPPGLANASAQRTHHEKHCRLHLQMDSVPVFDLVQELESILGSHPTGSFPALNLLYQELVVDPDGDLDACGPQYEGMDLRFPLYMSHAASPPIATNCIQAANLGTRRCPKRKRKRKTQARTIVVNHLPESVDDGELSTSEEADHPAAKQRKVWRTVSEVRLGDKPRDFIHRLAGQCDRIQLTALVKTILSELHSHTLSGSTLRELTSQWTSDRQDKHFAQFLQTVLEVVISLRCNKCVLLMSGDLPSNNSTSGTNSRTEKFGSGWSLLLALSLWRRGVKNTALLDSALQERRCAGWPQEVAIFYICV